MKPQTFLFMGKSGSGKGTQADLFIKLLKEKSNKDIVSIGTGDKFRDFIEDSTYTSKLGKNLIDEGGLFPAFLPIWVWTSILIKEFDGTQNIVFDGICRRIHEASIWESAMEFYGIEKPVVFLVDVSDEWSEDKLLKRGRSDDTHETIMKRLGWFKENVVPVKEYFKNSDKVAFYRINGEQTIEEVHNEIISKISW